MGKILKDVQNGKFARQWIEENETGQRNTSGCSMRDLKHPIEKVGATLRARMPWLNEAHRQVSLQQDRACHGARIARDPLLIFDTTLRDGEQSPGCSMTQPEKLRVARALAELGVDVIEAGFPAASRGDWESVNAIAREVRGPDDLRARALQPRGHRARGQGAAATRRATACTCSSPPAPSIASTSSTWREEQILRTAVEGVRIARELCDDVEFSPEDASRTELEFLAQVVEAVIEAGATTVNIPDTVGYTVPDEFAELFRYLRKNVRGIERIRLSVHCHDDLGMAVANSLTAVVAGARQIECTINGIGERAGNCSLEEVVMALQDARCLLQPAHQHRHHAPLSDLAPGLEHHRHADAAQQGGGRRERLRARGRHPSARHAAASLHVRDHAARGRRPVAQPPRARQAQRPARASASACRSSASSSTRREFNRVFEEFKALADKQEGAVRRRHRSAGAACRGCRATGPWTLAELTTTASTRMPRREATRAPAARRWAHVERTATGDGPVDAAFKAIEAATGIDVALRKFEVRGVTEGEDAQGEAVVYVEYNQRTYRGSSVSTNIVESSTQAFLEVINRIELSQSTRRDAPGDARAAPRAGAHRPRPRIVESIPRSRPCPFPQRSSSGSTASWCPGRRRRCTCCRMPCTTARRCSRACARTQTPRGRGDLPPARSHAAPVRLGQDLPHQHCRSRRRQINAACRRGAWRSTA